MEGGALRVGLGCGGEGGTGPTLIWYLRRVGETPTEVRAAAAASTGPTAGLPWAAARAATAVEGTAGAATAVEGTAVAAAAVVGGGAAAAIGPGLDLPAGGGEELRIRGLKLCPLCVFTMAGLRKKRRGYDENERRGWGVFK